MFQTDCLTQSNVQDLNGQTIHNNDGSVSIYIPNEVGVLMPFVLTQPCCLAFNTGYTFDIDTQKCLWSTTNVSGLCSNQAIELIINSTGDDGSIFQLDNTETCSLTFGFDYLFKFKCEDLTELIFPNANKIFIGENNILNKTKTNINQLNVENESLYNQLNNLMVENLKTNYSIHTDSFTVKSSNNMFIKTPITNNLTNFSNTGFNKVSNPLKEVVQSEKIEYKTVNYCLTELGLQAWGNILGSLRYNDFLKGNPDSYSAFDVEKIYEQNLTTNAENLLIFECTTPFGYKTKLINEINSLNELINSNNSLITINEAMVITLDSQTTDTCNLPIGVFEYLDVSVNLEVVNSDNTLSSVFTYPLFPSIGVGNLYNYLTTNTNSGFYVCGESNIEPELGCKVITLNNNNNNNNISSCETLIVNLRNSLYVESGLSGQIDGINTFNTNLNGNGFSSNWLSYNTTISDTDIISQISNKKIKISLTINNNCGNLCILLDNIQMNKACKVVDDTRIDITKSPGFKLTRIIDNKKSWLDIATERVFNITNTSEHTYIRQTDYDVNDERLIINSKELDLNMNIASAVEHDVWCYISDNECILTGITNDCVNTCGDTVPFNELLTTNISGITTIDNFDNVFMSELIDAKTRKTIKSYATLKALYERYLDSVKYCGNNSSGFNYMNMDAFTNLIGNYWVDIIEQMIPATTIWGSIKIYTNTIFDAQKFKYKTNTTFINSNPFTNILVPSPINGTNGECTKVDIVYTNIQPIQFQGINYVSITSTSPTICLAQYNIGSEFIGTVKEISGDVNIITP